MSKMWKITEVQDVGDMIWLTMMNAPKEMLEPNTQHLKTFYPVSPDDNRSRQAIIETAIEWLRQRAVDAIAKRHS